MGFVLVVMPLIARIRRPSNDWHFKFNIEVFAAIFYFCPGSVMDEGKLTKEKDKIPGSEDKT